MNTEEMKRKLETLPWQALHTALISKGVEAEQVVNKDKSHIIQALIELNIGSLEVERLVDEYIYGDRVTFTLWTFNESLDIRSFEIIEQLEGNVEPYFDIDGFRNLRILTVERREDRYEVLYVYSREYRYLDEQGQNKSIWEQHRGCIWVGINASYLACISKHDKMTSMVVGYVASRINRHARQLKPPKTAIDKCVNPIAISRIALLGVEGEKTVVSRTGGLTDAQSAEVDRVREGRFDTSGSYLAMISDDISVTVKYNVSKGSIGLYKHLSADLLFKWSKKAIDIMLEEVEKLKGRPAKEIFAELGRELKWTGLASLHESSANWLLTQVIAAKDAKEDFTQQVPSDMYRFLEEESLFIVLPRIYCDRCDDYKVPVCKNCQEILHVSSSGEFKCKCGAPLEVVCDEGHSQWRIANWYVPTARFMKMIEKNLKSIFPDSNTDYNICIMGDTLHIAHGTNADAGVEVFFGDVNWEKDRDNDITEELRKFAVRIKEKCEDTCSQRKISRCLENPTMFCLPKAFYSVLRSYRPQPHKGGEYGDVSGEVYIGQKSFEMKAIIKKNSMNKGRRTIDEMLETVLLSTSSEGQEIIRQFVEQGLNDTRCQLIMIMAPQYFDAGLKGTLRFLARLGKRKVMFVELDEVCKLLSLSDAIQTP